MCEEGQGITGCSEHDLALAVEAEFEELTWPLRESDQPQNLTVLDLLEFIYRHTSKPSERNYHDFYRHQHLAFDREAGQEEMHERINRLLSRAGLIYELTYEGRIERLGSPAIETQLEQSLPPTEDPTFDELLEAAVTKFHSPDQAVRREALESLWDAFERMKTMLDPNKRSGAEDLLAAASQEATDEEEDLLRQEMKTLTAIGNDFRIRHHEVDAIEPTDDLAEYLFGRLYAFIYRVHASLPQ